MVVNGRNEKLRYFVHPEEDGWEHEKDARREGAVGPLETNLLEHSRVEGKGMTIRGEGEDESWRRRRGGGGSGMKNQAVKQASSRVVEFRRFQRRK